MEAGYLGRDIELLFNRLLNDYSIGLRAEQAERLDVFPRFETVTIERLVKFGGDRAFESYDALEVAFESGELHPSDLKPNLAQYLDQLVAPGRKRDPDRVKSGSDPAATALHFDPRRAGFTGTVIASYPNVRSSPEKLRAH